MATFLSDYFGIDPDDLEDYGALNISVVNDLPLFIDPFLLFHSEKPEYVALHELIIEYLVFLKDKANVIGENDALLKSWFCFPEVKQNWLGFSVQGNGGSGLGIKFAKTLHANLHRLFPNFGEELISQGSHLEKVCLIANGVGKDNISDFTTNLIKDYLCEYTAAFAQKYLSVGDVKNVSINNARFNYQTEAWESRHYTLPWVNGDFVILSPKDMLTRDENWINRGDLVNGFEAIPTAIPDSQLRAQISNYFERELYRTVKEDREPSIKERGEAAIQTLLEFPELIDYYIKQKELSGDRAADISAEKVIATELIFVEQLQELQANLERNSDFYHIGQTTYEETHARLEFLKDVIENKGGHKIFYHGEEHITREKDVQILFRLVWFGSPSGVGTEANDGRGPVDFKISRGASDQTLVEVKLAKNTHLKRNLQKQLPIYQAASDAQNGIKLIIYFSPEEKTRVDNILEELGMLYDPDVVLVDARDDNKPSGSKA